MLKMVHQPHNHKEIPRMNSMLVMEATESQGSLEPGKINMQPSQQVKEVAVGAGGERREGAFDGKRERVGREREKEQTVLIETVKRERRKNSQLRLTFLEVEVVDPSDRDTGRVDKQDRAIMVR